MDILPIVYAADIVREILYITTPLVDWGVLGRGECGAHKTGRFSFER